MRRILNRKHLPIEIILRRDVLILLDPPSLWKVLQTELLALVEEERAALGDLEHAQ